MKKLFIILLAAAMVIAFASCGGADKDPDTTADTASDTSADTGTGSDTASDTQPAVADNTSYSEGLDDNGFLDGIRALDYVTLPDYDPMSIPESVRTVSEENVQGQLDAICENYIESVKVTDRAVKDKDTVNIDYVGSVDGVEFERGSTNGAGTEVTIGETDYIDDFLEQIIGHMPGDNFDINVTFPDPYTNNPDLAGKDAVFNCTVNHIVEKVTPEMTDELVAAHSDDLNGFTTVAELRADIEDYYRTNALGEYIQTYLIENSEFSEVPDAAYQYQVNSMLTYYRSMATAYGMKFEDAVGTTEEAFIEQQKENNMDQAKLMLAIQAIAEDCDKIKVDDEVLKKYFKDNVGTEDYSTYVTQYGKGYVMMVVTNDTVIDFLKDNATFTADATADK
ncbi:MAG: FKBP-type peptidyl-prolyl cis-trans isomerase [Clostridia bacterium]|nr:FKBP-type peptidyl-prolyl cis-trans isomerase [Clostridia bacterium]